jgi:mannose-6-phosphate isomerase-like protein (cupin superfamily)
MNRHLARRGKSLTARGLAGPLCLVAMAAMGCSSRAWKPPPASVIPVHTAGDLDRPPSYTAPATTAPAPSDSTPAPSAAPKASAPADLPADLTAPLAVHVTCDQTECAVPGLYPPSPAIDGKAPAVLWSHDLGGASSPGAAVSFPRHAGVDLFGVVLRGRVQVKDTDAAAAAMTIAPWGAFRAPGAGVRVMADTSARVVFAVVSGGEAIADVVVKLRGKDRAKLEWQTRPSPIEAVDLARTADLSWAGGAMHARIGFEGDKQRASLGLLIASKDTPVAQHQHDTSWELLAVLRGAGTAKRASGPGSTELASLPVSDGAVVMMPKGVQHAWTPDGTKPLIAIQMYVPPGPEQRFRKLAEAAAQERARSQ